MRWSFGRMGVSQGTRTLDLAEVGVLAAVAAPLAEAAVSIFAVSTFDTDYILLPAGNLPRACDALSAAGHVVVQET